MPRVAAWTVVPALALMSFAGIGYATDGFIAQYPQAVRELRKERAIISASCCGETAMPVR